MQKLLEEHNDQILLHRALAEQLHKTGRTDEAISELDAVGDRLMEVGDKAGVVEVVKRILSMNPPNADDYRQILAQLQNG